METVRYWIVVASKDHVQGGVAGGFAQACHGKAAPLKRMQTGDWVICYSPRREFGGAQKYQAFTAIGRVVGDTVYEYDMGNDFVSFRRNVAFLDCTEVPILPLIPELGFIRDKQKWGYVFRTGFFEIQKGDFNVISNRMLPAERMNQDVA